MMDKYNNYLRNGIVIQARTGSTRLPIKMLLPFYDGKSLFEVFLQRLVDGNFGVPIVLATTSKHQDDKLEVIANSCGISVYRGDENDVLDRFIQAAEFYNINYLIRVCADNPFIELSGIQELLNSNANLQYDYVTYMVQDVPVIKSHYGFWAEGVTLKALKTVVQLSDLKPDHEHVTKFVYEHPEIFSIKWIALPSEIAAMENIRLTVDTETDFQIAKKVFEGVYDSDKKFTINQVIDYLKDNPEFLDRMEGQIINNQK